VARFPDSPRGHYNLGLYLTAAGTPDAAIPVFERALALAPTTRRRTTRWAWRWKPSAAPTTRSGSTARRCACARTSPGRGRTSAPASAKGRPAEAVEALRRSLALAPSAATVGALLANLTFSADLTAEQLRDEHVAWAERYANARAREPAAQARTQRAGTCRLRVRRIPLPGRGAFLRSTPHPPHRRQFHVSAYASPARRDAAHRPRLGLADVWKMVTPLTDEALAENDPRRRDRHPRGPDGHAAQPLARVRLPARGHADHASPRTPRARLRAMDYRVTDAVADPPGASEALYVEKLLRLPDLGWL